MLSSAIKLRVRQQLRVMSDTDLLAWCDEIVLEQLPDHQLETLKLHLEMRVAERRERRQRAMLSFESWTPS